MENQNQPKKEKKTKKKITKPGRGIESMYRISMNSHVQFNKIADNKSNILISVSAIIISVLLSTLLPDFMDGKYEYMMWPFGIILLTCILTMVFAIISTIPRNTKKYTDLKNVDTDHGKLLFFGNFYKMSMEDYVKEMRNFQENDQNAYDALSQNFYILGKLLAKKYLYLYIAYRVFLIGFIATILSVLYITFR